MVVTRKRKPWFGEYSVLARQSPGPERRSMRPGFPACIRYFKFNSSLCSAGFDGAHSCPDCCHSRVCSRSKRHHLRGTLHGHKIRKCLPLICKNEGRPTALDGVDPQGRDCGFFFEEAIGKLV